MARSVAGHPLHPGSGLEQDLLRFLETGIRADAERLRSLHAWIERVRRHVGTMQHDVSQLMPCLFVAPLARMDDGR